MFNLVACSVFMIVAIAHLVRAICGWDLLIGRAPGHTFKKEGFYWMMPRWVSWFAALAIGALAVWGLL